MIAYTFEEQSLDDKTNSFVMRFPPKYRVLEEFFFGDVHNFCKEIKATLQKARLQGGQVDFTGNMGFLEARKETSLVGLLYGTEDTIEVSTLDLLALVVAYDEKQEKGHA